MCPAGSLHSIPDRLSQVPRWGKEALRIETGSRVKWETGQSSASSAELHPKVWLLRAGQRAAGGVALAIELSRGPVKAMGRRRDDARVGKSSTHLVRVGAMSHSGFANYVGEKEKQRGVSRPGTHMARQGGPGPSGQEPPTPGLSIKQAQPCLDTDLG